MESLAEVLSVIHQGRLAIMIVGVMSVIYLQHFHVPVIEVVAALAVRPSVHAFCEVHVRDGFKIDVLEIHKVVAAPVIHLHERDESDTRYSLVYAKIQHTVHLLRAVDVAF